MKEKKYLIIGIVSTLILMLGFTLAYFTPQIIGEGKKMTVNTANLEIIFTDTSEVLVEDEILPGWSTTKTFKVENRNKETYYYDISMKEYINTFVTDYLEYKITSTNGYNMEEYKPLSKSETTSTVTLEEGISIEVGETHTYTISFRYKDVEVNQAEDMNKTFEGVLSIIEGKAPQFPKGSLGEKLLLDNPTILERTDFDSVFTTDNIGILYKASGNETEDGSDVYYFAGNAKNNWVKFGKDQDEADLYWRIIRTNEDGSVRLLYIGPDKATTSAFIKIDGTYMSGGSENTGMYNNNINNTMYVGYMYGSTGSLENNRQNTASAPIKTVTDLWYSKTLLVKKDSKGNTYDTYVSKTSIYCNDRSGEGYASSGNMAYGANNRLEHNNKNGRKPTYKCGYNAAGGYTIYNSGWVWNTKAEGMYSDASVADKFSVSTSKGGNGQLEYPIAQITADEIAYAGGRFGTAAPAWYYYNSTGESAVESDYWWTMSPYYFFANGAFVFSVSGSNAPGFLTVWNVGVTYPGVRPVVSLKSCALVSGGNGSSATPYEIEINSTCAQAEN